MNILFLGNSFDPHTALWVQYFEKSHNVFLFSDKKENTNKLYYSNNIKVIEVPGIIGIFLNAFKIEYQKIRHLDMLLSTFKFVSQIQKIIKQNNIDIIHAHSLYYGYLASFLKTNLPIVFTPMGSDIILYAQQSKIHNLMARKAFTASDVVTGDSKLIQSQGYKVGAKKQQNYIIQNGVDTTIFLPKSNNLKEEYNIQDGFLLFSPRAIANLYNIDEILKSLAILKEQKIHFKCMFTFSFGNEHYDYLKKLTKSLQLDDHVVWLGYIDYKDMQKYYNASDLIISIPSSDSSPKSVYEAMFCGKPVIVSDLPWSHEFLEHNKNIFRTKLHDVAELAKNIKYLLENKKERDRISSNALQKASELYSYEKNMIKMEMIMFDLIETKKANQNEYS